MTVGDDLNPAADRRVSLPLRREGDYALEAGKYYTTVDENNALD